MEIAVLGIDLGKNSCSTVGLDDAGAVVLRRRMRREGVAARGMNLGIEDAFVLAHCAADALRGDLKRLSEYGLLRHDVHARVVAGVDRLTRLARGQPAVLGLLRRFVMPAITMFGPTRRSMIELVTGLDHPIKVDLS